MSIVEALLEQIREQLRAHPDSTAQRVHVRVGHLRQVVPDTLTFCYEAVVRGTELDGSRLLIEEVPAEARCRRCSLTFPVTDRWFECPRCGVTSADLIKGDELQLLSLEIRKVA